MFVFLTAASGPYFVQFMLCFFVALLGATSTVTQQACSATVDGVCVAGTPRNIAPASGVPVVSMMQKSSRAKWVDNSKGASEELKFEQPEDLRHDVCKKSSYDLSTMPKVAVVIPYLHEDLKLMKRTVGSLLKNTPPELLDEILFVDDGNDDGFHYTRNLTALSPKVRVHRNAERQGLIKAKVTGAAQTSSPVIFFMEPHCLVNQHWLEPLLVEMMVSHKTVVVPLLDTLPEDNPGTYIYIPPQLGGFDWSLTFGWKGTEMQRNSSYRAPDPYPMPALSGGLFAIWRDWWEESGTYDDQMREWGSEHIEMSLRMWRCGGSVVAVPCSRVGHMFRKARPYVFHSEAITYNKRRLADVWLDNHVADVESKDSALKNLPSAGDITARLALKERLGCKSMDWYLDNVYPELKAQLPKIVN